MSKHTELPWYVGAQNDGLYIIDSPSSPAPYDGPIPKANGPKVIAKVYDPEKAAFIVHACNCHYDLLDALKDARESVVVWGSYAGEYFQDKHGLTEDIERIDAAIAKAEQRHE